MSQLSDYITEVQNLVHDPNEADFNTATLTDFINDARNQVALDCGVGASTFITGLNTITQQETYPLTGFVGGVEITNPGSGGTAGTYTLGIAGGGGTGAAGTYTISGGVVTTANMTNWGTGYISAPAISFPSGGISGAAATAVIGVNIVNVKLISILWGSLKITFDYLAFPTFQAFCRAYAFLYSRPGCFTVHRNNQLVYTYPISDQPYPMEWDVIQLPTPLVNMTDPDNQIIAPWNYAVKYWAAGAAMASLQRFDAADYWWNAEPRKPLGKYQQMVRNLPAGVTPYRVFNPYTAGRRRVRRM